MIVAVDRPSSWEFPLFVHVLGAMVLVGAVAAVVWMLLKAWRGDEGGLTRTAFRTLLLGVIPAFVVMRAGAQWIADKENLADSDVSWIDVGYGTSDLGGVLLIVATVVAGIGARRLRRDTTGRPTLGRVAAVLTLIPLVLFVVAVWAMTTKPT